MAVVTRRPPGRFATWQDWRQAVTRPKPRRPFPCPMCWAQGYILEPFDGGYLPVVCQECWGVR